MMGGVWILAKRRVLPHLEVRMKRLMTSVVLPYIVSLIPIAALLWWGHRMQRTVRLATKEECPKGSEPVYCGKDGRFVIFGVSRGSVRGYSAEGLEVEMEISKRPCVQVAFSFPVALGGKYCYKKATIIVRGTPEDVIAWQKRIEILKAA